MVQKTLVRRGRPRQFDADVALRAAGERFRTQGFSATSLDDLVDATGLARPSLYAAFGDKRALYLAALAQVMDRAERGFAALVEAKLPLREALRQMFNYVIDGFLTGERAAAGCIVIGTAPSLAPVDAEVRAALATFIALEDDYIAALLKAAGSPVPESHARIVAAVIQSLSVRARAGASRAELEQLAEDCIALVAAHAKD